MSGPDQEGTISLRDENAKTIFRGVTKPTARPVAGGMFWTDHSLLSLVLDRQGQILPDLSVVIDPQFRMDRLAGPQLFLSSYEDAQRAFQSATGGSAEALKLPGITAGIVSTSAAGFNFGHWVFDVLPSLSVISEYFGGSEGFESLVVPSIRWPWQRATIELLGLSRHRVIGLDENPFIECESLVCAPFPRPAWDIPAWLPAAVRALFPTLVPNPRLPKKIYLSRRDVKQRNAVNERELLQVLEGAGYQEVVLSNYSLSEQIVRVMSATEIVSIHSSALDLMVFCLPQTRVIEIFGETGPFPEHKQIASYLGCEYRYLLSSDTAIRPSGDRHWSNFQVDMNALLELL